MSSFRKFHRASDALLSRLKKQRYFSACPACGSRTPNLHIWYAEGESWREIKYHLVWCIECEPPEVPSSYSYSGKVCFFLDPEYKEAPRKEVGEDFEKEVVHKCENCRTWHEHKFPCEYCQKMFCPNCANHRLTEVYNVVRGHWSCPTCDKGISLRF